MAGRNRPLQQLFLDRPDWNVKPGKAGEARRRSGADPSGPAFSSFATIVTIMRGNDAFPRLNDEFRLQ
jgi:hypothetical protein